MTIDEILKWAPDNEDVFDELLSSIKKGSVIPFVGAGMSAPIYPQWGDVLSQLTEKLSSEKNREAVNDVLNDSSASDTYTRAADKLIELRSETNVFRDLLRIFNEDKIVDADLIKMAVYLLPFLFHDKPAITTNYDRVLEHVFRLRGAEFDNGSVFTPDSYMAGAVSQQSLHCLFKIHGDIGKETIDGRKLILSGESYDRVYTPDSELVKTLKTFYQGKMMLFLGSSLKYDRTLNILKQITETGQLGHYAILPCSKEMLDNDVRFFGERGIRAIFYDPDHHEAVKIILEELLRGKDPDRFRLYRSFTPSESKSCKAGNPFVFDSGAVGFYGRDNEMEELKAFADTDEDLLWWGVVGEGGSGKTRLVYEFTNRMREEGWNIVWISRDDLKDLNCLNNKLVLGRKNIVIADYGRQFARELGNWMIKLSKDVANGKSTSRNRVLIIDRKQDDNTKTFFAELTEEDYNGRLEKHVYKKEFLGLTPLNDESIKEILRSYAIFQGKCIDDNTAEALLSTLENVDPDFKRPLYAMFIANAYCANEDPTKWDREKALEWATNREAKLIAKRIADCTRQGNSKQRKAIEEIRFIATINGDISIEDIKLTYQGQWERYEREFAYTATGCKLEECIEYAGMAENGVIKAIRPDLLGEFFVSKKIKNCRELLEPVGWSENEGILSFLLNMTYDYREQKEMIETVLEMILETELNSKNAIVCSALLMNITALIKDVNKAVGAVELLKSLYDDNRECALRYAEGLFNLSIMQPIEEKKKTILRIGELSRHHEKNEDIALVFAMGLLNLSHEQSLNDTEESVRILEKLSRRFDGNEKIAQEYGKGLYNLIHKQLPENKKRYVILLSTLHDKYKKNAEIAMAYAMGLYELSLEQSPEETKKSVYLLGKLSSKFVKKDNIAQVYSQGLYNLSAKLPPRDALKCLPLLRELYLKHDGNEIIALRYARELYSLSAYQSPMETEKSIKLIGNLSHRYHDNEEIAIAYAMGLYYLSFQQSLEDKEETMRLLGKLKDSFNENEEISEIYAQGLCNLSFEQVKKSIAEAEKSINIISKLSNICMGNEGIAIAYAKGLYNLSCYQPPMKAAESIGPFIKLCNRHEHNEIIATECAKGLMNMISKCSSQQAKDIISYLNELCGRFESSDEIIETYSEGLVSFMNHQILKEKKETVKILEELSRKHSNNGMVAIAYALGLSSLINVQPREDAETSLLRLKKLKNQTNNKTISNIYNRCIGKNTHMN